MLDLVRIVKDDGCFSPVTFVEVFLTPSSTGLFCFNGAASQAIAGDQTEGRGRRENLVPY